MRHCKSDLPHRVVVWIYLIGLLYGLNAVRHVKHFAEIIVKNNYYKNVSFYYGDSYRSSENWEK